MKTHCLDGLFYRCPVLQRGKGDPHRRRQKWKNFTFIQFDALIIPSLERQSDLPKVTNTYWQNVFPWSPVLSISTPSLPSAIAQDKVAFFLFKKSSRDLRLTWYSCLITFSILLSLIGFHPS